MPPELDEYGIPVRAARKNDIDEYGIPIKKKVSLGLGGAIATSSVKSPLPSGLKSKEENYDFTSKENSEGFRKAIEGKRIVPEFFTDKDAEKEATTHIQESAGKILPGEQDPIGKLLNSPLPEYQTNDKAAGVKVFTQKLKMLNNAFSNGEEAKAYLQKDIMGRPIDSVPIEELRQLAGDNVTKQTAITRYDKQRKVEQSFDEGRATLEDAAINYAILNGDENAKMLVEKAGGTLGIPPAMKGEKVLQFLMNPDLHQLSEKYPALKEEMNTTIANFPVYHPEYATKLLADAIAKKRDEKGLNSSFANVVGKESTDKIMDELIAEGSFPANYRNLYAKTIRPKLGTWQSIGRGIGNAIPGLNQLVNEAPIPTPGILENIEQGAENFEVGTAKSIVGLTGIDPRSEAQKTYSALEKQYSTPEFEPSGLWQKATMHGGQMIPFVAGLVGGTSALKATNLIKNPSVASGLTMVLATHGDNAEKARILFPRNDTKQFLYTGVMDGLNAVVGKFLPGQNIPKLLSKGEPVIADALKAMVDGKITTDAAKSAITNFIANTAKGSLAGGEFTAAIAATDDLLTQTLQGKGIDFGQTADKTWDAFKTGTLSTVFLAGGEAALKSNKGLRSEIISMAANPEHYKELLNREAENNPELAKVKDDILSNLDYIGKVYAESPLEGSKKEKYVLDSLAEKVKLGKAELATDPTIKKQYQQEAKNLHEIKEGALKGIEPEKIIENQAIKEVKQMYNDGYLSGAAGKELETIATEGGEGKFDPDKVVPFLKQVAEGTKKAPDHIQKIADEMFPDARKEEVVEDKISEPIELDPTLPEDYKLPEQPTVETEVNVPEIKSHVPEPEIITEESNPITESVKPEKEILVDAESPKDSQTAAEGEGGENEGGITHAANEVRRQDRRLPEYEKSPESFEQWNNEAEKAIREGYDVEKLMDKIQEGHDPTPVENSIRKIYIATLDGEIAKNPSDALLAKQKRFIEIGDLANSRAGRNLVSLKGEGSPLSSISDFYVSAMEAKNTDKLTDAEKAEIQKDYEEVKAARDKAEAVAKDAMAKFEEMKAENELLKQKKNQPKKSKGDWAQQRKEAIDGAREALKKIRTGESGVGVSIPLVRELIAIAPHVKKYVGGLLGEGAYNLKEVVTKAYEEFKGMIDGLTEKDIHDIIAGNYNEKKQTKNEIIAKRRELQSEAKLLNEYENLLNRGEPKEERKKQKRNQRLTDIRKQIDELNKERGTGKYSDEAIAKRAIEANKRKKEEFDRKLKEGDFEKEKQPVSIYESPEFKKKNPKLYNELLDSQNKAHDSQLKFEKKLVEEEMKKWGLGDKARNILKKFSGTLKTLFASFDASAIAIQNLPMIVANPIMGGKGVVRSYKGFLKQKAFDRYLAEVHNASDWPMVKECIRITEPKSLLESGREEFFPDRFKAVVTINGKQYGWIKIKGHKYELVDISKPFERQFTMLGNILRLTKFRTEAAKLYEKGLTWEKNPEEFKTLGKRINNLTSSSDIPQAYQNTVTRTLIWSTRLIAAKLNMLGISDVAAMIPGTGVEKGYYKGLGVKGKLLSRQQVAAVGDLAKFAVAVVAASYLYALARGGTVNTDPDDNGFLDVEYESKDGSKKSMNFTGGFSRYISLLFQMGSGGKRKDGVFKKYGNFTDPIKEGAFFLAGKAPPLTRTAFNVIAGKDPVGQPADISTEAAKYKMPLAIGQIYKQIERDGLESLFKEGILMYIGVNSKDSRDYVKPDTNARPERQSRESRPHKQTKN